MDFLRKIPQAALIIVASLAIVGVGVAIGFVTSDSEPAMGAESGDRPASDDSEGDHDPRESGEEHPGRGHDERAQGDHDHGEDRDSGRPGEFDDFGGPPGRGPGPFEGRAFGFEFGPDGPGFEFFGPEGFGLFGDEGSGFFNGEGFDGEGFEFFGPGAAQGFGEFAPDCLGDLGFDEPPAGFDDLENFDFDALGDGIAACLEELFSGEGAPGANG